MTERILPRRRREGRRHKRVRIYDTAALMVLFETDDEEEVRRELARRGVTPHESAGRMFVSGYELNETPPWRVSLPLIRFYVYAD
jgi:hypothetical protein